MVERREINEVEIQSVLKLNIIKISETIPYLFNNQIQSVIQKWTVIAATDVLIKDN